MSQSSTPRRAPRAMLCVAVAAALMSTPHAGMAQGTPDGGKGWFLVALIPAVADALKTAFASSVGQGATCVFGSLLKFSGAQENENCKKAVSAQLVNNVPNNGAAFNAIPAATAQNLATQPILSFVVKKLANDQPNGQELEPLLSGPFEQSGSPIFTLRTGEAFAIAFATSVPGRVRLINTDADQVVTPSAVYEAIPGNDNRMPRAHEGGIVMIGKPGTEYLDVEFVPCVSASLTQDPRVAGFVGQLPLCSVESATKRYLPAVGSGKGGAIDFGGKAMKFPPSGDPGQPVAIAPANYAKGEMLRFRITIAHAEGRI